MSDNSSERPGVEVTRNDDKSRFEAHVDGELAGFMDFRVDGDVVTIPHTEVDPAFGGRGIGSALVRIGLEDVRESGRTVRPVCPFVADYIKGHPDYADLVAAG